MRSRSLHEQFHQIERRSLVGVDKSMIADDAMQDGGSFLVNPPVISVIRARDGRLDALRAENTRTPAVEQRLVVGPEGIGERDPVVTFTDRRAPSWPPGVFAMSPR